MKLDALDKVLLKVYGSKAEQAKLIAKVTLSDLKKPKRKRRK